MKYLIIDERMREIEKEYFKMMGYQLLEIETSEEVYQEISAHVDIFACKVGNEVIIEPTQYIRMPKLPWIISGINNVEREYPFDIKYNVCTIGKKAFHLFRYTDTKVQQELIKNGYELINTTQGYTNCSIAVIDDNSAIVTDKGLYQILKKEGIDVLYLEDELDIKLFKGMRYSEKKGFIGGCISRVGNDIVVFGDLNKIDLHGKIRKFIESKNIQIVDFENLDVIDYGGVIEVKSDLSTF